MDSLIYFDVESLELQQWDTQIHALCGQLNAVMDACAARGIGNPPISA